VKLWRQQDTGIVEDVGRRDRPALSYGAADGARPAREDGPLVEDIGRVAGERTPRSARVLSAMRRATCRTSGVSDMSRPTSMSAPAAASHCFCRVMSRSIARWRPGSTFARATYST
jgi:hypothetical protein